MTLSITLRHVSLHAEYRNLLNYAECRYAVCRYAECRYAECRNAECRYAECRYAECRYAECRYAGSRGEEVINMGDLIVPSLLIF